MSSLIFKNVTKTYPSKQTALNDFSLTVKDKEFMVILGADGSGKSSVIRMVAGLEQVTSGEIITEGKAKKVINDVEPRDRDVVMIMQNYGLYPQYTVYDNLGFALKLRRVPQVVIAEKVKAAAEFLGISDQLMRKPKALNSEQKQRVALGRAIVREAGIYLFDEPLAHLDDKLRLKMRAEIAKIHVRLGSTFLYTTSDAVEAVNLADRICVLSCGYVQQVDTPANLYDYPVNLTVAELIGSPKMSFIKGRLVKDEDKVSFTFADKKITLDDKLATRINADCFDKDVLMGVRPEDVTVGEVGLAATVESVSENGVCSVKIDGGDESLSVLCGENAYEKGLKLNISVDCAHVYLFDAVTEMTLLERDEGYKVIAENEDAGFIPLDLVQMKAAIDAQTPKKSKGAKK